MTLKSSTNSASATASPTRNKERRLPLIESLLKVPELAPELGLLAVVLFFTAQTPNFWSPQTMTAISTVASTIGIVAVGGTMLMICGEFDLSVGQNFAFTPIVWAILFVTNHMNEWAALAIALSFAISVGGVNGRVTAAFGVPSSR